MNLTVYLRTLALRTASRRGKVYHVRSLKKFFVADTFSFLHRTVIIETVTGETIRIPTPADIMEVTLTTDEEEC